MGGSGEEIGLFSADGKTLFDSIVFGEKNEDVSYGRTADGGEVWDFYPIPMPSETNGLVTIPEDVNGDGEINVSDLTCRH